jgi:hypothetical protein
LLWRARGGGGGDESFTCKITLNPFPAACAERLTHAEMGVDGGVAGSAGEVLVLPVGYVQMGAGVAVLLGQAKVDDVDLVAALGDAHEEVVGLDVTVQEVFGVHILDPRQLG